MQNITVKLEAFEGPLDLLYHLIEKNEIDIYDIPIAVITEQYIEFINAAKLKSMESMSSFLLMATTLLEIKSKMLLPSSKAENEEYELDPREELVVKLIEYKKFKHITDEFKTRQELASLLLYKEPDKGLSLFKNEVEPEFDSFLNGITLDDIFQAFEEVMKRKEQKVDKVRSGFKAVERDLYTIDEKIEYITDLLSITPKIRFSRIFRDDSRKMEVVVTFLALLELIKMKKVNILQESIFDEIIILSGGSEKNEDNRA